MNLLNNITQLGQTILPQIPKTIEEVTYDAYEDNNPFRNTFNNNDIKNKNLKIAADTTKTVGSEAFSAFTNPFYLTHKIIKLPTYYKTVVDTYKNKT